MEDNILDGLNQWVKSTEEYAKNMQDFVNENTSKLTDEEKKQYEEAMSKIDMDEINSAVKKASSDIMNTINKNFR